MRPDAIVESTLLHNRREHHSKTLQGLIRSADRIQICVAFLKSSGLQTLVDPLVRAVARGAKVEIIAGADFYLTEPSALERLQKVFRSKKACTIYLTAGSHKSTFHPKLYYFSRGTDRNLVVGSANMTAGGLGANNEVSIHVQFDADCSLAAEIERYLVTARNCCPNGEPLTSLQLANYKQGFDAAKKVEVQSRQMLKRAISTGLVFNTSTLERYLLRYRQNEYQQQDWATRKGRYREAKKLLLEIAKWRSIDRTRFLTAYEQLVGGKGISQLWPSGSLFRAKNAVARQPARFQLMLREILRRIHESPADVFGSAMKYAKGIPGLGVNVVTEILTTLDAERFAPVNQNPITSLLKLGVHMKSSTSKTNFTPADYVKFLEVSRELRTAADLKGDLAQVDHFLNFVFWDLKRRGKA